MLTYYEQFAAAYARGKLGLLGSDEEVLAGTREAELRIHRFKRSGPLPRVRKVLGTWGTEPSGDSRATLSGNNPAISGRNSEKFKG